MEEPRNQQQDQNQPNDTVDKQLDIFSVKLIKVVGVVGIIIGFLILIAFWVWVFKWLYGVGE
jgi:hypothetical protein